MRVNKKKKTTKKVWTTIYTEKERSAWGKKIPPAAPWDESSWPYAKSTALTVQAMRFLYRGYQWQALYLEPNFQTSQFWPLSHVQCPWTKKYICRKCPFPSLLYPDCGVIPWRRLRRWDRYNFLYFAVSPVFLGLNPFSSLPSGFWNDHSRAHTAHNFSFFILFFLPFLPLQYSSTICWSTPRYFLIVDFI